MRRGAPTPWAHKRLEIWRKSKDVRIRYFIRLIPALTGFTSPNRGCRSVISPYYLAKKKVDRRNRSGAVNEVYFSLRNNAKIFGRVFTWFDK